MERQPVETTIYSLSEAPPCQPSERRDGERHLTLYRVGSVCVDGRRELCLIKNISAGGMMIRVYCPISIGEMLTVELKSGQPVHGRVSWVRSQNVGVAFDEPVDVIEILSASMHGPRPRMPRIEVNCHAMVRENGSTYRIPTCDISQGGIKLEAERIMPCGTDVIVTLPGLSPEPGVVRWNDEGYCGITFNRLLPLPTLVGWLHEHGTGLRAAAG